MSVRIITWNGEAHTISVWARKLGISDAALRMRIRRYGVPQAFTRTIKRKKDESLCWLCDRTAANCEWIHHYQPVKGWSAEAAVITCRQSNGLHKTKTYMVTRCPKYIPSEKVARERTGGK